GHDQARHRRRHGRFGRRAHDRGAARPRSDPVLHPARVVAADDSDHGRMSVARISARAGSALAVGAAVAVLAGCGGGSTDSGGLTARDRKAAQSAVGAARNPNITAQLLNITPTVQAIPAACRVRLVSKDPSTFRVYLFWIPWLGSEPYSWVDMQITKDPKKGTFHLGTAKPVLPGGRLTPNGQSVDPWSLDTTLL